MKPTTPTPEMTPEIEEKLISWCKAEKYSHGDDYHAYLNKDAQFVVGYSNDYPLQHGKGKDYILTEEEFNYAMNRPLTEIEQARKFWYAMSIEERANIKEKWSLEYVLFDEHYLNVFSLENPKHRKP